MKNMKKILIGLLFLFVLFGVLLMYKPVRAMIPPPASRAWMFFLGPKTYSNAVTVTVTWYEGTRQEKVELKTYLKDRK